MEIRPFRISTWTLALCILSGPSTTWVKIGRYLRVLILLQTREGGAEKKKRKKKKRKTKGELIEKYSDMQVWLLLLLESLISCKKILLVLCLLCFIHYPLVPVTPRNLDRCFWLLPPPQPQPAGRLLQAPLPRQLPLLRKEQKNVFSTPFAERFFIKNCNLEQWISHFCLVPWRHSKYQHCDVDGWKCGYPCCRVRKWNLLP